ncbi:hypothetical protein [Deinococcus humi]|uniref:Uncharacterized protein n=1 Tax=Deinococcus humi TaxID=662880 RepID=A0A7W8K389_9DEIO|nr:hypothetical protein [Deinococcus humi]MBB5366489.1 hypothetical protein [Deinococcus humi]GGI66882.1 hypothetical protein GCM10008949_53900 [Deinococcus humi]
MNGFVLDSKGFGLGFSIGWIPALVVLVVILGYLMWARRARWDITQQTISAFGQTVTIKPNVDVARIAHKTWTELASRKAAIQFEEDNDVIIEVYDSWYALFTEVRLLVKEIPAEKIRTDSEMRKLVRLMMETLNRGLRPHLTKWQARFRRWLDHELKKHEGQDYISIQEIQKKFPDYDELVADLRKVNKFLLEYAEALEELAHGKHDNENRVHVIPDPTPSN